MNLSETFTKLDGFLFHIKNNLEELTQNFKTLKQLNIEEKEYVILQNLDGLTIKAGFNWLYDDVYFGVRIYIDRDNADAVKGLESTLNKYQWGYSKEEKYVVVSHERRLADYLCTNDDPELENKVLMDLFYDRIGECKIVVEELKK